MICHNNVILKVVLKKKLLKVTNLICLKLQLRGALNSLMGLI
jgi:hypothetical protein